MTVPEVPTCKFAVVVIPVMLAFLAVNSSKVKSPVMYALPPTYRSLSKVPTPTNVDNPATFNALVWKAVLVVTVVKPANVEIPATSKLPLISTVTKVEIPLILMFLPVTSSYTMSSKTKRSPPK